MILAISSDGTAIPIAFKTNANAKSWLNAQGYDVSDYSFLYLKADPVESLRAKAKIKSAKQNAIAAKKRAAEKKRVDCAALVRAGKPLPKSCGGPSNYPAALAAFNRGKAKAGRGKGKK